MGAADAAAEALEAVHGTPYTTGRASDILCKYADCGTQNTSYIITIGATYEGEGEEFLPANFGEGGGKHVFFLSH